MRPQVWQRLRDRLRASPASVFLLPVLRTLRRLRRRSSEWPRSAKRSSRFAVDEVATQWPQAGQYLLSAELGRRLDGFHVDNLRLCLAHQELDFLVVSFSPRRAPEVGLCQGLAAHAHVVCAPRAWAVFAGAEAPSRPLRGRVVKLLSPPPGAVAMTQLERLWPHLVLSSAGEEVEIQSAVSDGAATPVAARAVMALGDLQSSAQAPAVAAGRERPMIFVWPVFMAVGGVERNTIEILRRLHDRYRFVVVTIESHFRAESTLHHQLRGLAEAVYDLAEIAPQRLFLEMFAELERRYRPDLVWICNGSPWQVDHAASLRRLFAEVPIVDQQVYDTHIGWIEHYHKPGIQSFDRFVAINRKIRAKFVGELRIPPERVDLIYHALDDARFDPKQYGERQRASIRARYGLPEEGRLFAFVGRSSPQKRPFLFLEMVQKLRAFGNEDAFVMVGDGELAAEVDAFLLRQQIEGVRRLAFVENLAEIYAVCSGLVMTSKFEGLPIAMLEALAMGLPVLATDVGDIGLILGETDAGEVVPVATGPDEFARAFLRWRGRLEQYHAAARNGADDVRARFSSVAVAEQYDACFRKALAQFAGRTRGESRTPEGSIPSDTWRESS